MRIARCRAEQRDFWAVLDPDLPVVYELPGCLREWAPGVIGPDSCNGLAQLAKRSASAVRFIAPLEPSARVICVGTNYGAHLAEAGVKGPAQPIVFLKPYSAMIGPEEEIAYSPLTEQLDYEVEFVAVMGSAIGEGADPLDAVLGYTIGNDVSARDLQKGPGGVFGLDLYSGKCLDRTSPLGPWIVTRQELNLRLPDLEMQLTVDGELRQRDRTSSMHWNLEELLRYIDARTRLLPGDVIFTGTPAGVGYATGRYLEPGSLVVATIEGIGTIRNRVGARLHPSNERNIR